MKKQSLTANWFDMAKESESAAFLAEDKKYWRSAASRYYYAMFQAATALLHHRGLTPPAVVGESRQAWSHTVTPDMLREHLNMFLKNRNRANKLGSNLSEAYKIRVQSDYVSGSALIAKNKVAKVRSDAGQLLKVVADIIGAEQ